MNGRLAETWVEIRVFRQTGGGAKEFKKKSEKELFFNFQDEKINNRKLQRRTFQETSHKNSEQALLRPTKKT